MSNQPFRWRTVVEVAVIAVVIYVLVGAPGLSTSLQGDSSPAQKVPVAKAKVESLVYPDKDLKCPEHEFRIHIFSTSPLVVYVDDFVSEAEARHLVDTRYDPTTNQSYMHMTQILTQITAQKNGKSLPSSTKAARQRMNPSANPKKRSSTATQLSSASSSGHCRSRAGRRKLSSSVCGRRGTMSVGIMRIIMIGRVAVRRVGG